MAKYISKQEAKAKVESIAQQKVLAKLKKVPLFMDSFLTHLALSLNPNFQKDRTTLINQKNVTAMMFLLDCETKAYRTWNIFRQEMSDLLMPDCSGRLEVDRRGIRGAGTNEMDRFAGFYDFNKLGLTSFKNLPLHKCKNNKDKIKMISESDASPQVKLELISEVLKL